MAQLYTTGPALFYVGAGQINSSSRNALFLGTSESPPEIHLDPKYSPVFNDLGGDEVPYDFQFKGEQAFTFATLNRYNESVYQALANRPRHPGFNGGVAGRPGYNLNGDMGALIQTQGYHLTMWVQFPYAQQAAFGGLPAGYRFPVSILRGPDRHGVGMRPKSINVVFHSIRRFYPRTNEWLLYDHNIAGLPAVN